MKKKHLLYILIILITAALSFAAGRMVGDIHVQKVPQDEPYHISSAASNEDLTGAPESNSEEPGPASDGSTSEPQPEIDIPEDAVLMYLRIITIDNDGWALLAETGEPSYYGSIYYQSLQDIPIVSEDPEDHELQAGMEIEIAFNGNIAESYPGILGQIYQITVPKDSMNDLCVQYLQVLRDLWTEDSALNHDITKIGVDLSQTRLSQTEKMAVAWAFAQEQDLMPVEGTFEELTEQGYIDGKNLYWEDGCFFSIKETGGDSDHITFEAEKWRSGLGAIFFTDCSLRQNKDGAWTDYKIGGWAIS